jgi:hypothetical protein
MPSCRWYKKNAPRPLREHGAGILSPFGLLWFGSHRRNPLLPHTPERFTRYCPGPRSGLTRGGLGNPPPRRLCLMSPSLGFHQTGSGVVPKKILVLVFPEARQGQSIQMPKHKQPESAPTQQHREFVKAARKLGVDESEEAFDKMLKRIASAPSPKSVQKRKKAGKRK